jgi:hypothetical protein
VKDLFFLLLYRSIFDSALFQHQKEVWHPAETRSQPLRFYLFRCAGGLCFSRASCDVTRSDERTGQICSFIQKFDSFLLEELEIIDNSSCQQVAKLEDLDPLSIDRAVKVAELDDQKGD